VTKPDGAVKEFRTPLADGGSYRLPIGFEEWNPGEYHILLTRGLTEVASYSFVIGDYTTPESSDDVSQINDKTGSPEIHEVLPIALNVNPITGSSILSSESSYGSVIINDEIPKASDNSVIKIFGHVVDYHRGSDLEVTISKPNNITEKLTTFVTQDGTYQIVLFENWEDGLYAVKVDCEENKIGAIPFVVMDNRIESMEQELFLEALHAVELSETETDASDLEETLTSLDAEVNWYNPLMVKISGTLGDLNRGAMVDLTITRPDNSIVDFEVHLSSEKSFEVSSLYQERWQDGTYTITASHMGSEIISTTFSK